MNVMSLYKLANLLWRKRVPLVPKLITYLIRLIYGGYVPHSAKIGEGTKLGYGALGIVIHSRAIIGMNCLIHSGVTIGGTSKKYNVPVIGDNVLVGSGAKIIGPVKVGSNVVIGANSVVTIDIPDGSLVVGLPGKIIKSNINIDDYM